MKYLLLLVPCILAVAAPFYNIMEPQLFGFPFYYWFNLLLVPISVIFIHAADVVEGDNK